MSSSINSQAVKSDSQKQLENLLKQYNLEGVKYPTTTPPPPPATSLPYGKSNDAILAALLKEQGITPNTPRLELFDQLQGVFKFPQNKKKTSNFDIILPDNSKTNNNNNNNPTSRNDNARFNLVAEPFGPSPTKPSNSKTITTSGINLITRSQHRRNNDQTTNKTNSCYL